jgi:ABC-type glycerol-3-phosphate transport system substrate-binding protein
MRLSSVFDCDARRWLRGLGLGLAVALAAGLSAGCGGSKVKPVQVIRVTRNIGGREGFRLHFEAWKAAFERDNAGWQMELIDLGNSEGEQYYKSRLATGDLPEIVMTWQLTNFLADGGHLVPLADEYYQRFGIPLPPAYKGKRYTSQAGVQIQGIVVNKRLWAEAGITAPPRTWDEFIAALRQLKAKGIKPLVYGGREWSASMPLFYAIATTLYDAAGGAGQASWTRRRDEAKVSFATDPQARKILERMVELLDGFVEKGALSDGYNQEQADFYGGKGATWMMGCWIGGDIEPNKVDFEMEYWPVPSLSGREPRYIYTSSFQNGWAITSSATGEKLEKARAALDAFYDPHVYQLFLNGESQFKEAQKVAVAGPSSAWAPAQALYDNMAAGMKLHGTTVGYHIGLDDMPPPSFSMSMARVMQEILAGNKDVDALLKMLDDDWDSARKAM